MLNWKKFLLIASLAVMLLALAACQKAVDEPGGGEEPGQPVSQVTPAEVQAAIFAPLANLFADNPGLLVDSLAGLGDDVATADFVVATVDDWPVMFSELAYRAKSRDIALLPQDHNFTMNTIVEEKSVLSEATALGVLPSLEDAAAYSAQEKEALLAESDGEAVIEAHATQLGISVDDYWNIVAPYTNYKDLTTHRVWLARYAEAEAAGLNVDAADAEDTTWAANYYWDKKTEWKQQVTYTQVTDIPELQFSPNLQNLVLERRGNLELDD